MRAEASFTVEVGGVAIAFRGADPRWSAVLEPRYGPFRTTREPDLRVELVARDRAALDMEGVDRLRRESPALVRAGGALRLRSPSLEASVWPERGVARLFAPLDRHGVDVLLPLLLSLRLDDALIVHSTLAIENGRAYLCAGPSGSGKSTLAELLGERCVCDELALLRRGADGGWRAFSMPYWRGRPGEGTLAAVHLLRHGDAHRREPLGRAEAIRRLAGQLIWPAHSAGACERSLELLELLVSEIPVSALCFRPSADVWPVLSAEEAA